MWMMFWTHIELPPEPVGWVRFTLRSLLNLFGACSCTSLCDAWLNTQQIQRSVNSCGRCDYEHPRLLVAFLATVKHRWKQGFWDFSVMYEHTKCVPVICWVRTEIDGLVWTQSVARNSMCDTINLRKRWKFLCSQSINRYKSIRNHP